MKKERRRAKDGFKYLDGRTHGPHRCQPRGQTPGSGGCHMRVVRECLTVTRRRARAAESHGHAHPLALACIITAPQSTSTSSRARRHSPAYGELP